MDRLWEHIEHLAPGLVLAILVFFGLASTIDRAFPLRPKMPREAILVGGAFVAFGYLLGVINSSLARLVFIDILPFLDWLRWRHLARAVRNSPLLGGAVADLRSRRDFDEVEHHVNEGTRLPWRHDSRWRRKRAVFHSLSGRAQTIGGSLAAEFTQRRREARLMRSAVFPAVAAGTYLASKSSAFGVGAAAIAVLLIVIAYYYREISVIETFEVYGEAIYEKKFRPLGT